jgi:hypothetical protein
MNAQMRWLRQSGAGFGGSMIGSDAAAQQAANRGWPVVEAFETPIPTGRAIAPSCDRVRRP